MEIELLSDEYEVRRILERDIEAVYRLCSGNPLYYEYCPPFVTKEGIRRDMTMFPPDKEISDKYFIGFYQRGKLMAVMDLIDGYPDRSMAYIGFFMTEKSVQQRGVGTAIIQSVCKYLTVLGYASVRLAWVKGNPQAEHFWRKNYFQKIRETSSNAAEKVILAERVLRSAKEEHKI